MAYTRTNWIARAGTALNRFLKSDESTEYVTLTNTPEYISQAGTPFSAANMNNIEDGVEQAIADAASKVAEYTRSATGDIVTTGADGKTVEDSGVLLTDVVGVCSKTTNGYTKLPNGVIFQWGTTSAIGQTTLATITLPIPFPTAGLYVGSSPTLSSGIAESNCSCYFLDRSNIRIYNAGFGARVHNWLAIGY